MKLTRVKLHNFRAVLDQEFCLKDYGLLVGSNKAGKNTSTANSDVLRIGHAQIMEVGQV